MTDIIQKPATKMRKREAGFDTPSVTPRAAVAEHVASTDPNRWTVIEMFGGREVLHRKVETPLDAHELLKEGLPTDALHYLVDHVVLLNDSKNFSVALGMSLRTHQRKRADQAKRLNREQSGRAWKFAEVLAKATEVFGSQERAEEWLTKPATALDRRVPLELLDTAAGLQLVEELLTRLDYGVFT